MSVLARLLSGSDQLAVAPMRRRDLREIMPIEQGAYPDYHVRKVEGKRTPASNPDTGKKNNLG